MGTLQDRKFFFTDKLVALRRHGRISKIHAFVRQNSFFAPSKDQLKKFQFGEDDLSAAVNKRPVTNIVMEKISKVLDVIGTDQDPQINSLVVVLRDDGTTGPLTLSENSVIASPYWANSRALTDMRTELGLKKPAASRLAGSGLNVFHWVETGEPRHDGKHKAHLDYRVTRYTAEAMYNALKNEYVRQGGDQDDFPSFDQYFDPSPEAGRGNGQSTTALPVEFGNMLVEFRMSSR